MRTIDADALKEQIRKFLCIKTLDDLLPPEKAIVTLINRMPTIEPKRKTGKWKYDGANGGTFECSECGFDCIGQPSFCPDCGAEMEAQWP